jgi:hypothetical protein
MGCRGEFGGGLYTYRPDLETPVGEQGSGE